MTPDPIEVNVQAIAKIEQAALAQRSRLDRVADSISDFAGSMQFVAMHALWFGLWIVLNSGRPLGIHPFDPFPYLFLALVVSLEAIFLSTFVLMKQNRMSRQADRRAHLDLQVNLLAERETTAILQMLTKIYERTLQAPNETVQKLAEETDLGRIADHLTDKLPQG